MNPVAVLSEPLPSSAVDPESIHLGKDVLELLSSAMYVDCMNVYREYVQNAVDGIDEAKQAGVLNERGRIEVVLDSAARAIRIRDNGNGTAKAAFIERLASIGGSAKRGTAARGFRGVGRLIGLAFAQEVVFRSRAHGDDRVSELRWDCRRLKAALSDATFAGSVTDLITKVVTHRTVDPADFPERFFEVELVRVVRQGSDKLMNPAAVSDYLSQVGPVPFSADFKFGDEIVSSVRPIAPDFGEVDIVVNGGAPVVRPHANELPLSPVKAVPFEELIVLQIPATDGGIAAVAWFLHHTYEGAVPASAHVKGVRLRIGNIQIGDHALLEEIFPEPRFNGWSVGEVHILDRRIVPNARRDNFERNAHYRNLINHLAPVARDIARKCRTSSSRRSKLREFESAENDIRERLAVASQGALPEAQVRTLLAAAELSLARMERIAALDFWGDYRPALLERAEAFDKELRTALTASGEVDALSCLREDRRSAYEEAFALIYECSTNRSAAKALIDRMIEKLARGSA